MTSRASCIESKFPLAINGYISQCQSTIEYNGRNFVKRIEGPLKRRQDELVVGGELRMKEMLWEREPQACVATAFSSSPKLSQVFL